MPAAVYDDTAIRLLCQALATAFRELAAFGMSPMSEHQIEEARRSMTRTLMSEYEAGERDPCALARTAVKAFLC